MSKNTTPHKSSPICTVLLITYNHAPYVAKCIESVLSQKTTYNYIIKIFDDASTDGSSDIIRAYAKKYPDKIEAHIATKNQGGENNIWNAYNSVDTKYAILTETDDYWCDENKLQMQIDALEANPDCSFCSTNNLVTVIHDQYLDFKNNRPEIQEGTFTKAIITKNDLENNEKACVTHVSSRLIRMSAIKLNKIKHKKAFLYDAAQFFYLLTLGNMYWINKICSVYVKTGHGIWSASSVEQKLSIYWKSMIEMNEETQGVWIMKIAQQFEIVSHFWLGLVKKNKQPTQNTPKPIVQNTSKPVVQNTPNKQLITKTTKTTKLLLAGLPILKIKNKLNKKYIFILGLPMLQISNKTTTNNKEQIKRIKIFGLTCLKLIKQN